jgi:leader peptidase (prepilin peptidase)/N-methyltransferase
LEIVLYVLVALLGLAVGSFLNVVISRVPAGESVVRPASRCPGCGSAIRAWQNVPVLSWVALRGRCASCREPISLQYPAVELLTAAAFVLVVVRLDWSWSIPAYLYLAAIGIALLVIDLQTHRLPNAIVLPSYPVLAVLLGLASWGAGDLGSFVRALIGGAILFGAYFAMALAYPGGMGFGDVKLAGLLGAGLAFLGWGELAVGGFAAFLLGGVFSIGLLLVGRAGRKSGIPFGPWMIAGAALGLAAGGALFDAYLGLY